MTTVALQTLFTFDVYRLDSDDIYRRTFSAPTMDHAREMARAQGFLILRIVRN